MDMLTRGLSNFRANIVLWPMLFLVKLSLALLVTIPLYVVVGFTVEHSVFGNPLTSSWSTQVLFELVRIRDGVGVTLLIVTLLIAVLAFLVKQFFNGGLYFAYMRQGSAGGEEFFAESAFGFRDHIVISLMMIPVYFLFLAMGSTLTGLVPQDLFGNFSGAVLLSRGLQFLVLAAFMIMAIVISEAMRLHRTAMPDANWKNHLTGALAFLQTSGVKMYGYYWLYFLPFLLLWLVVEWLAVQTTGGLENTFGVVIELVLFQLCAFARVGQSLLYTATTAPVLKKWQPGRFVAKQTELALG